MGYGTNAIVFLVETIFGTYNEILTEQLRIFCSSRPFLLVDLQLNFNNQPTMQIRSYVIKPKQLR